MDFAAIAAAAVSLLVPFLAKAADKAAEAVGTKSADLPGKLYGFLRLRLGGKPAAAQALKKLSEAPQEADRQAAMCHQLTKAMENDPALAGELERLTTTQSAEGVFSSALNATVVGDGSKVVQQGGSGNTAKIS